MPVRGKDQRASRATARARCAGARRRVGQPRRTPLRGRGRAPTAPVSIRSAMSMELLLLGPCPRPFARRGGAYFAGHAKRQPRPTCDTPARTGWPARAGGPATLAPATRKGKRAPQQGAAPAQPARRASPEAWPHALAKARRSRHQRSHLLAVSACEPSDLGYQARRPGGATDHDPRACRRRRAVQICARQKTQSPVALCAICGIAATYGPESAKLPPSARSTRGRAV